MANSESAEYDYLLTAFDDDQDFSSESSAASEAKKLGLKHVGRGKWANAAGKVVKQTVHGKLLGVRDGNKIKKTVGLMKESARAIKHHGQAALHHAKVAEEARANGDTKKAEKHEKAMGVHYAERDKHTKNYKKLHASIGEHGDIAHRHIMEHHRKILGKQNAKTLPKAEPAKKPGIFQRVKKFFSKSEVAEYDVDHFISNSESPEYDYLVTSFDDDQEQVSESSAASEAKKLGLHSVGHGSWANAKGKVVKHSIHGKLVSVREGNKIKKTVTLMKASHKSIEENAKAARFHHEAAKAANRNGDSKEAAKHVNALRKHGAKHANELTRYEKLRSSIGAHGDLAHLSITKHADKMLLNRAVRNEAK